MTLETLEKANDIRDEINALADLEHLFRNASMPGADIRACNGSKVINKCTLWTELADTLIATLHAEADRLDAELRAL